MPDRPGATSLRFNMWSRGAASQRRYATPSVPSGYHLDMTRNKKLLVAAGAIVIVGLVGLLAIPLLFKGRIEARARAEIERTVAARVDWSGVGLSLLRDFPNPTLTLSGLTVVGVDRFEGDTLASVGSLRLALDGRSVVRGLRQRGPVVVRSVRVEEPNLHLVVLEDGSKSWDIVQSRGDGSEPGDRREADDPREAGGGETTEGGQIAESAAERDLAVELRSFELSDGRVVLENAASGLYASVIGFQHSLAGNFSRESLTAVTRTQADGATVRFAGTPYLSDVALDFVADLEVDVAGQRLRFQDNELRLNDLLLRFAGEVAADGDDIALDLTFEAPRTEFGQMLSLVPVIYANDFAALETAGSFALRGSVRGAYGDNAFPAFALDATVDDGSFRYPDLPLPARDISAALSITNPGGDLDSTVVDLSRFHIEIGDQPLDIALTLRTPVSDPEAHVRVEGVLDLSAVARTVKLENGEAFAGTITADAAVRARRSDVDSARYERIDAQGMISARGVTLRGAELRQPVDVEEATVELSPERAELHSFSARLGSSDLQATGQLDNVLGFMLDTQPLRGSGTFTSRSFVLDEWKSDDDLSAIAVPSMLDLTLEGTVDQLVYGALRMADARGTLYVRDQRLTLEGFSLRTLGGRIGMNGHYETTDPARPAFAMDMTIDSLDVASASEAFLTVQSFAPIARYAQGTFSADLDVSGVFDTDMTPMLDALDGNGSLLTSRIAIEGFPLLDRLSETLRLSSLATPTVSAIRSSLRIENGRMYVEPFQTTLAGLSMGVSGSNGIDQTLDYTLGLALPRGVLGDAAEGLMQDLAARAGQAGLNLGANDSLRVRVGVTGTVSDPALDVGLGDPVASVRDLAQDAAEAAVQEQIDEAQRRLEAEGEEARQRAQERADSIVAEAERRAEAIRVEARRLADEVRAEGDRRAEEVLAQATNPLARRAAEPIAERIRQEANERADGLEREADERADALIAEARRRAASLIGAEPGEG